MELSHNSESTIQIKWDLPQNEKELIDKIVARAKDEFNVADIVELAMDITAVHLNCCELDLKKLLKAKKGDFMHDVFLIKANVDRKTAQLRNEFVPRHRKKSGTKPVPKS